MTQITPGSTIGIIGGGQLGKMTALAASYLGYNSHILVDHCNSPASKVFKNVTIANYNDYNAIEAFAKTVDVVTLEFENIPHKTIQTIENIAPVRPNWQSLYISQNRLREKDFLNKIGIPTTKYYKINSTEELKEKSKKLNHNCILKTTELGYDGKGQWKINTETNIEETWNEAQVKEAILEEMIDFSCEISVIIARNDTGETAAYPATRNIHKNGILDVSIIPANVDEEIASQAKKAAIKIINNLEYIGILAVEFFVTKNNKVLVNEIAPRPHNSGHWTLDACITSQFEQHVRAICNLPLGSTEAICGAKMINLIGNEIEQWKEESKNQKVKLHIYGKDEAKPGRKMGHITILNNH